MVQMVDIEADTHDGSLVTWHHCHSGEVVAADVNVDKQQVIDYPEVCQLSIRTSKLESYM